jgi:hypothetical protein
MDAARARLIGTLEQVSAELAAGGTLSLCLRRLPQADRQSLSAPLVPSAQWRWPWAAAATPCGEAIVLARIALAVGAESPDRLAAGLAQLARDLRDVAQ